MSQKIDVTMSVYQARLGIAAFDLLGLLEEASGHYETAAHAYAARNAIRDRFEEKKKKS